LCWYATSESIRLIAERGCNSEGLSPRRMRPPSVHSEPEGAFLSGPEKHRTVHQRHEDSL